MIDKRRIKRKAKQATTTAARTQHISAPCVDVNVYQLYMTNQPLTHTQVNRQEDDRHNKKLSSSDTVD